MQYALKRKNYDDLILTDVLCPRILILILLPKNLTSGCPLNLTSLFCAGVLTGYRSRGWPQQIIFAQSLSLSLVRTCSRFLY
jgi:hypothetical protein